MGSSTKGAKSIWRLRCVGSDLHSLPAERLRRAVLWRKCCGRCSSPRGAYPVLDEPALSSRGNLPPKTLQRWRASAVDAQLATRDDAQAEAWTAALRSALSLRGIALGEVARSRSGDARLQLALPAQ